VEGHGHTDADGVNPWFAHKRVCGGCATVFEDLNGSRIETPEYCNVSGTGKRCHRHFHVRWRRSTTDKTRHHYVVEVRRLIKGGVAVALELKEGRVKSALRTGIGALPRRRSHDAEEQWKGRGNVSI
jgi:glutaredoxin-related protein